MRGVALQLLPFPGMPGDFEQMLRDVFGESVNRFTTFERDQMKKLQTKLQEIAREALHDELSKLHGEIGDLRARVAKLEAERAENASESLQSSF